MILQLLHEEAPFGQAWRHAAARITATASKAVLDGVLLVGIETKTTKGDLEHKKFCFRCQIYRLSKIKTKGNEL